MKESNGCIWGLVVKGHRCLQTIRGVLAGFGVLLLAGCTGLGTKTVVWDRAAYSQAVGDSWKREALLNIVRLRYVDIPVFMQISSIVNGYSRRGAVNGSLNPFKLQDTLDVGGDFSFEERPTISYAPMSGVEFTSLLQPIPVVIPLALIESSWRADLVLRMTVRSINDVGSRTRDSKGIERLSPKFLRILALIRQIQESGMLGMETRKGKGAADATVLFFRKGHMDAATSEAIGELKQLLGLQPEITEFRVARSSRAMDGSTLVIRTRSVVQIMSEFAAYVEVPPADQEKGVVLQGAPPDENQLVTIHSGTERPEKAQVAVAYDGHWFWIDRNDLESKLHFAYLLAIIRTSSGGESGNGPVLTIPTG